MTGGRKEKRKNGEKEGSNKGSTGEREGDDVGSGDYSKKAEGGGELEGHRGKKKEKKKIGMRMVVLVVAEEILGEEGGIWKTGGKRRAIGKRVRDLEW